MLLSKAQWIQLLNNFGNCLCIDSTSFHVLSPLSAVWSICVVVLAPKLPGCNPPSMTQLTWCVSAVEWLPALARLVAWSFCWHQLFVAVKGTHNSAIETHQSLDTVVPILKNCTQKQCRERNSSLFYFLLACLKFNAFASEAGLVVRLQCVCCIFVLFFFRRSVG